MNTVYGRCKGQKYHSKENKHHFGNICGYIDKTAILRVQITRFFDVHVHANSVIY
jgi:hypothetical protein